MRPAGGEDGNARRFDESPVHLARNGPGRLGWCMSEGDEYDFNGDEGAGFDPATAPTPRDYANVRGDGRDRLQLDDTEPSVPTREWLERCEEEEWALCLEYEKRILQKMCVDDTLARSFAEAKRQLLGEAIATPEAIATSDMKESK